MITRLSHMTQYVLDQDEAKDFFTEKLGFEVRMDTTLDGFRWLTVGPANQPDMEIVLMQLAPGPALEAEDAETLKGLVEKGAIGGGVFATDDCRKTYEELKAKGVEFMSPPAERPYGVEALFRDNTGYWYSLTQRH